MIGESQPKFKIPSLYFSTHFLSLEALLTVTEAIERQCHKRVQGISNNNSSSNNTEIEPKLKKPSEREPVTNFVAIKGSGHLAGKVSLENEEHLHEDEDGEEEDDRNVRFFLFYKTGQPFGPK